MNRPSVLLVHGVATTGRWHDTTASEFRGLFDTVAVKYRFYHGWTGPLKVYVWPTAVLLLAAFGALDRSSPAMIAVLVLAAVLVLSAEIGWSGFNRKLLLPLLYIAVATVFALIDVAAHQSVLVAAIAGMLLFLDVREYGNHRDSALVPGLVSLLAFGAAFVVARTLAAKPDAPYTLWLLLALGAAALVEPFVRRWRAFQFVGNEVKKVQDRDGHPHVIAHSLGTYLIGHLVNENENLRFGRVVFTGCVLDRKYPWKQVVQHRKPPAVLEVRNYVGNLDIVPILTGTLRALWVFITIFARVPGVRGVTDFVGNLMRWRPLGSAGQRGFREDNLLVHSLDSDSVCPLCEENGRRAPVHNVRHRFAGHSTLNDDPDYHFYRWLPFLWRDTPEKFDYWKEICRIGYAAISHLESLDPDDWDTQALESQLALNRAEQVLLAGPWYWPLSNVEFEPAGDGKPLGDYIEELLKRIPDPPPANEIISRVPILIFKKFAGALDEKSKQDPDPEITSLLEPRKVLIAAVYDAVKLGNSRR